MVDLRLNILDEYVDFFVISESTRTHQGKIKKINFDIKKFPKFKNKIKFLVADYKNDKTITMQSHPKKCLLKGMCTCVEQDHVLVLAIVCPHLFVALYKII